MSRQHPNLDEDGYELDSALDNHRAYPQTFKIPDEQERTSLKVGDLVKLLFVLKDKDRLDEENHYFLQGEKMWVTVTKVEADSYIGVLESLPVSNTVEALKPGDPIYFTPDHVAATFIRKTDPRHPEYLK